MLALGSDILEFTAQVSALVNLYFYFILLLLLLFLANFLIMRMKGHINTLDSDINLK